MNVFDKEHYAILGIRSANVECALGALGYDSIGKIMGSTRMKLESRLLAQKVEDASVDVMVQLQAWLLVERDITMMSTNSMDKFTFEVWDKFRREFNPHMDHSDPRQRLKHYDSFEDIKQEEEDTPVSLVQVDENLNRFRVEVKDIPKLSKKNIQGSFDTWDTLFTAKMELAGMDDLVSDNFVPPLEGVDSGFALYPKKDSWLKNCILTATLDTNAYPNLDLKLNG